RRGMRVTGNVHSFWVSDYGPDVARSDRRIQWTPESRRIYTRDGELYEIGETVANPDLARTYERLAEAGPEDFYRGEIAAAIAADFAASGGFISIEDLAGYRPRVVEPVTGSYRGRRLVVPGPPAGGITLLQMLNFLERFDMAALDWPSPEAARRRVEAMGWAMADRDEHLADPLFTSVPVAELTDKEYAAAAAARTVHDSPTTTHVCAVDEAGSAVSLTHTLGSSSGVVTPGLGFTWNNYLNCFDPRPGRMNSLAPGKTRVTMMVPMMVVAGDGRPELVMGAPGGTRIVNGILQTLLNLVDHGMGPLEAVAAPRVDYQGETVQAEQRIPSDVVDELRERGYRVERRPVSYDTYFSRVQLIQVGADGTLVGASDPRGDGGIALRA
ncbi:MAG TPA: gamma-glutamyltransferase, partial [Candidatus Eisenbacteria bacterium]|nr:gamma-glutamyltransferase [Candidatus Eisenbacteria bacterium]